MGVNPLAVGLVVHPQIPGLPESLSSSTIFTTSVPVAGSMLFVVVVCVPPGIR